MINLIKKIIKKLLEKFRLGFISYLNLERLKNYEKDVANIFSLPNAKLIQLIEIREKSKSQLGQDLFVLLETNFKKNGFFIEFGATNGVDLSNTYLLEKEFSWQGILAEPAKVWHAELQRNRNCIIDMNCVYSHSGSKLDFNETSESEFSGVASYINKISFLKNKQNVFSYKVKTISLVDLLIKHNAPKVIDYISIDTEGSEFEILSHFDFDSYQFRVITCEHNYMPIRKKIYNLLTSKGYQRKYCGLSKWDDWYIKSI